MCLGLAPCNALRSARAFGSQKWRPVTEAFLQVLLLETGLETPQDHPFLMKIRRNQSQTSTFNP
jgi:hypothetical protein